jgi:glutamate racemase
MSFTKARETKVHRDCSPFISPCLKRTLGNNDAVNAEHFEIFRINIPFMFHWIFDPNTRTFKKTTNSVMISCMKNTSASLPIAVFDSGVGGLTVLRTLKEHLPQESFLYLGDMVRVPYGTKSPETIVRYTLEAVQFLISQRIKLLVIACHTASTLALAAVEKTFASLPVIGMLEPGASAACTVSQNGHIAVIATEATVKAQGYQKAIQQIRTSAQVVAQACSVFVALAEEGWVRGPIAESVARQYLDPLFNRQPRPDCLLLGCTHFPLLEAAIQKIIGPDICIINPAVETAHAVAKILYQRDLANPQSATQALTQFLVTDSPERFARVAEQFLLTPINPAQIQLVDTSLLSEKQPT